MVGDDDDTTLKVITPEIMTKCKNFDTEYWKLNASLNGAVDTMTKEANIMAIQKQRFPFCLKKRVPPPAPIVERK